MPRALVPRLAIAVVDVLGFTILIRTLPFYAVRTASLLASPFRGRFAP